MADITVVSEEAADSYDSDTVTDKVNAALFNLVRDDLEINNFKVEGTFGAWSSFLQNVTLH